MSFFRAVFSIPVSPTTWFRPFFRDVFNLAPLFAFLFERPKTAVSCS